MSILKTVLYAIVALSFGVLAGLCAGTCYILQLAEERL